MKLSKVVELTKGEYLCRQKNDPDIICCMASDMMSDVLAFAEAGSLLITGLTNSQSVRTADIADISGIIYIRGKKPDEQTVELAGELSITLISTELGMFETCGILSAEGLRGVC